MKHTIRSRTAKAVTCFLFFAYLTFFARLAGADTPNVIVILADDLGYGDPGCYNDNSQIPTPYMDGLAEDGIMFTDAHSPSAVCTPSRYGLLTGRYCWRTHLDKGVTWPGDESLIEPGRLTLGSLFQQHGYRTGCFGKWHLGLDWQKDGNKILWDKPITVGPSQLGFDRYFGIEASLDMDPYFYIEDSMVVQPPTESISSGPGYRGGKIAPDFKHDEVLDSTNAHAVRFIEDHHASSPETPFFMYLSFSSPHLPWLPTGDAVGASNSGKYGDFVYMTDQKIGDVLNKIDQLGLRENTLVIVTSDNGARDDGCENGHLTNGNLKGQKGDIWEGGHRVPFIARWPGQIAAGSVSDETICLNDLMATFASMLDYQLPANAGEDSYNILPLLLGRAYTTPVREATVVQSQRGKYAIRHDDWFLSTFRGAGGYLTNPKIINPAPGEPEGELYNLAQDPLQETNLYLDQPNIVDSLSTILDRYKNGLRSTPWSWEYLLDPVDLPSKLQAEDYFPGENETAFHDRSDGNRYKTYRLDDVDVNWCDNEQAVCVDDFRNGEWLQYRINAPVGGEYVISTRAHAREEGASLHFLLDDDTLCTSDLVYDPDSSEFRLFQDTVTLPAGNGTLRVALEGDYAVVDYFDISLTDATSAGETNRALVRSPIAIHHSSPREWVISNNTTQTGSLALLDSRGRVLTRRALMPGLNRLSSRDLSSGVYMLRITVGGRSRVVRVAALR